MNRTKHDNAGNPTRPDITIHHRTKTEIRDNLLIIEIKIWDSTVDFKKLKEFTSAPTDNRKFQYQYGLALSFMPKPNLNWFQKGRPITPSV